MYVALFRISFFSFLIFYFAMHVHVHVYVFELIVTSLLDVVIILLAKISYKF